MCPSLQLCACRSLGRPHCSVPPLPMFSFKPLHSVQAYHSLPLGYQHSLRFRLSGLPGDAQPSGCRGPGEGMCSGTGAVFVLMRLTQRPPPFTCQVDGMEPWIPLEHRCQVP